MTASGRDAGGGEPRRRPGPEGGRRETNRRRRTESLAAAATALFLDRGIEAVTIGEIAAAAGIAKGSFYRYFPGKDALVASLFARVGRDVGGAFARCGEALGAAEAPGDLRAAYEGLAADLARALASEPDLVRLYLQEGRGPSRGARRPVRELSDTVTREAVELTRVAHRHGLLRPLDPRVSALAVIGAVERLAFAILSEESDLSPLSVPGELISMVLDGLRADGVRPG